MSTDILKDMVALVKTWPVAAQEELAGVDLVSGLFSESTLRV